ncbi:MAG: PEP/pyruvate-binding domain-containing protein [Proteobacteria bacterium]|nr:PEP/pyruvate-binding domain-containing protein [Pseudomonadota bacterium]
MDMKEIYWLDELSKDYREVVGNKCANLGELIKIGLRVPYGFALSVKAYETFMEQSGLKEKVDHIVEKETKAGLDVDKEIDRMIKMSATIREAIEECEMPPDMARQIGEFYTGLQKKVGIPDVACAVRSSGAVSMPGQMETYLNISGESEIIRNVKKVWASAYTTRAIVFRLKSNMPMSYAPIGIAVIMMIEANSAGVTLTVLPSAGDLDRTIVEGNFGLGESVVSGDITPDSFIINKIDMAIESRSVAEKTKMVVFGETGTIIVEIPETLKKTPCLDDNEILEIVRIGKEVEKYFGFPQDMEWVTDKRFSFPENIFWVQARAAKYTKKEAGKDEAYVADLMLQLFRK